MPSPPLSESITRLYPLPAGECALKGLYLAPELPSGQLPGKPFVYGNFISSLDGRVAIAAEERSTLQVPAAIANPRDWRLYQELAGRADILITSGRYFRQSGIGEAQDQLPVSSHPGYADILEWRRRHGLAAQPDIAILSRGLDIPLGSLRPYQDRRILVFTGGDAEAGRIAALTNHGVEIIVAGRDRTVDGAQLVARLAALGYRSIYAIAGPDVLHTLLEARVLNHLYLTMTHQLLAGETFGTLTRGTRFEPALNLRLLSLYLDRHAPEGASQWFSVFEPRRG